MFKCNNNIYSSLFVNEKFNIYTFLTLKRFHSSTTRSKNETASVTATKAQQAQRSLIFKLADPGKL